MQRIIEFLKPGGILILTVPYGRAEVAYPAHRIYDRGRLERVTKGLETDRTTLFWTSAQGLGLPTLYSGGGGGYSALDGVCRNRLHPSKTIDLIG